MQWVSPENLNLGLCRLVMEPMVLVGEFEGLRSASATMCRRT